MQGPYRVQWSHATQTSLRLEDLMTRALLLHRGDGWTANLERILSRRYTLTTRDYRANPSHQLSHELQTVNLAIVDVSIDDLQMRAVLQIIRRARMQRNPTLALVCITRVNRGPRFQYDVEEIGARFAYGQ